MIEAAKQQHPSAGPPRAASRRLIDQFIRLWPVVLGGKALALAIGESLLLVVVTVTVLVGGGGSSEILKGVLIFPAMLVLAIGNTSVVATLRASGELELALTMARPVRLLLLRFAPMVVVVVAQVLIVGGLLLFICSPLNIVVGLVCSPLPLLFAGAACLYWSLRLHGPGAVTVASVLSLVPAFIWIGGGEMVVQSENMQRLTVLQVVLSAARCQLGVAVAALVLLALAWRRLQRPEDLIGDG